MANFHSQRKSKLQAEKSSLAGVTIIFGKMPPSILNCIEDLIIGVTIDRARARASLCRQLPSMVQRTVHAFHFFNSNVVPRGNSFIYSDDRFCQVEFDVPQKEEVRKKVLNCMNSVYAF